MVIIRGVVVVFKCRAGPLRTGRVKYRLLRGQAEQVSAGGRTGIARARQVSRLCATHQRARGTVAIIIFIYVARVVVLIEGEGLLAHLVSIREGRDALRDLR